MIERRVAAGVSTATSIGASSILGAGLAEMPFFVGGLFGGDSQAGAYPVGRGGATITGIRGFVLNPETLPGKTATIAVWKYPVGGGVAVATGVQLVVPTNAPQTIHAPANYGLVEGEVMFCKVHLSDFVLDAYNLSWVVEF